MRASVLKRELEAKTAEAEKAFGQELAENKAAIERAEKLRRDESSRRKGTFVK